MNLHKKLYDENIWAHKYRPQTIDDVVIPNRYKKYFNDTIANNSLTNCILYGIRGSGKTTIAFILSEMLDRDTLYIEGTKETSVDILRGKLTNFVSSVSMNGKKKLVIIDEADGKGRNSMLQGALKQFIETFSSTCSFIFITNFINLMDKELVSRLESFEFSFTKEEQSDMKKQFGKILLDILTKEGYNGQYDRKVLAHIVNSNFPDMRKCLVETQKIAKQGRLSDLSIINESSCNMEDYYNILKEKDFTGLTVFVASISDHNDFFTKIYDTCKEFVEPKSLPDLILLTGTYAFKSASMIDQRINTCAFSVELMKEVEFK